MREQFPHPVGLWLFLDTSVYFPKRIHSLCSVQRDGRSDGSTYSKMVAKMCESGTNSDANDSLKALLRSASSASNRRRLHQPKTHCIPQRLRFLCLQTIWRRKPEEYTCGVSIARLLARSHCTFGLLCSLPEHSKIILMR